MTDLTWVDVVGFIAGSLSIGMFLSNFLPFREVWRRKAWGPLRPDGMFGMVFSVSCWGSYAMLSHQAALVVSNNVGIVTAVSGLVTYSLFAPTALDRRRIWIRAGAIAGSVALFTIIIRGLVFPGDHDTQQTAIGLLASGSSVVMYASPAAGIVEIIRTRDASRLSLLVQCMSCAVCTVWTALGIGLDDFMVTMPSVLGALLSGAQIIVRLALPPPKHRQVDVVLPDGTTAVVMASVEAAAHHLQQHQQHAVAVAAASAGESSGVAGGALAAASASIAAAHDVGGAHKSPAAAGGNLPPVPALRVTGTTSDGATVTIELDQPLDLTVAPDAPVVPFFAGASFAAKPVTDLLTGGAGGLGDEVPTLGGSVPPIGGASFGGGLRAPTPPGGFRPSRPATATGHIVSIDVPAPATVGATAAAGGVPPGGTANVRALEGETLLSHPAPFGNSLPRPHHLGQQQLGGSSYPSATLAASQPTMLGSSVTLGGASLTNVAASTPTGAASGAVLTHRHPTTSGAESLAT